MDINKETVIYGSFSLNAGNNGNIFFKKLFNYYNINAIYKSFSINNIKDAVNAAKCLNFGGFAISMPFKKEVIKCVDNISEEVKEIGACNTVVNREGKLVAHNTDYLGVKSIISNYNDIIILGNGGMAFAAKYAAEKLNINYDIIKRDNWDDIKKLKDKIILNCTPVNKIEMDKSNIFLDCLVNTDSGKMIYKIQAREQFYLYTGIRTIIDL